MAKNIINQIKLHIGEIVRIARPLKFDGKELQQLNELMERTSK
jgi:hypothetical protein